MHLALGDLQVEPVQRPEPPERLHQSSDLDDIGHDDDANNPDAGSLRITRMDTRASDRPTSAPPYRPGLLVWLGFGVLACLAGMAIGHLVAALLTPASSPVLAVGATVIDQTPTPMKEWAIRQFGDNDKTILVGSVLAVTILLAAVAGALAHRRFAVGLALLLALVGLAGLAALNRPLAEPYDALPALAAGLTGAGVLLVLRRLDGAALPDDPESAADTPPDDPAPVDESPHDGAPLPDPPAWHPMARGTAQPQVAGTSRRTLLLTAGAVAVLAGAGGWIGRVVEQARTSIGNIVLPKASSVPAPLPTGLEKAIPGISDFRTANGDFYRVDINLSVPLVPVDDWDLRVDGEVDQPFTLDFDELCALPMVERDITMTCVSNEVGGRYIGSARWLGVPLATLLERAGVQSGADQILSTAADGFTISTPLAVALDGRDALVAIGMNGQPLLAEHGSPARLIVPGLYGYVSATKWLRKLTITRYGKATAYWTERDWSEDGPIKVSSRIDTPRSADRVAAGRVAIGGVAWAQHRGIAAVEVCIDGGPWQAARLGPDAGVDYWSQWFHLWDATPGRHTLAVRATTVDGEVQTGVRATPFPDGSSGIQEILVTVEK
ncbi:molybdopterin-dependent oxidoreductase [Nocardioides alcanivorans]|uniref:molybdopterin-dependent oxidoreductase n=1 Tax=Nocardioides alcanivorans TaxID=2897352 RepID=UPI001F4916BE|nr:molybdopterin-dependent oxidoreductase [Nocardioides alcanivorans]